MAYKIADNEPVALPAGELRDLCKCHWSLGGWFRANRPELFEQAEPEVKTFSRGDLFEGEGQTYMLIGYSQRIALVNLQHGGTWNGFHSCGVGPVPADHAVFKYLDGEPAGFKPLPDARLLLCRDGNPKGALIEFVTPERED